MKTNRFFLSLVLIIIAQGCYLLNPKDKYKHLLYESNYNPKNTQHQLLNENTKYTTKI